MTMWLRSLCRGLESNTLVLPTLRGGDEEGEAHEHRTRNDISHPDYVFRPLLRVSCSAIDR